jgi:hypothetical protein
VLPQQFIDAGVVEFALFDAEAVAPHTTTANNTHNSSSNATNSNAHSSHNSRSSGGAHNSSSHVHGSSSASNATATAAAATSAVDYYTLELQLSDTRLDLRSSSSSTTSSNSSNKQQQQHPLLVLCNYVCDTLVQDAFRVQNGRLYENRVTVASYNSTITSMDGVEVRTRAYVCQIA